MCGSTIQLGSVTNEAGKKPPWWAEIRILEGEIALSHPLEIDATVELSLRDTGPLVHMLAETKKVVHWFHRLLEIKDVTGTARIQMGADGTRFDSINITGEHLHVEGFMAFGDSHEHALFHVRFHGIGAAIELREGEHHFTLIKPRKWYEERLKLAGTLTNQRHGSGMRGPLPVKRVVSQ